MKEPQVRQELHAMNPDDFEATTRLVESIKAEAREAPRVVIRLWLGGQPDSEKAALVFAKLDELVLDPVLEAFDQCTPVQQLWLMSIAVDSQVELRERLVAKLIPLLDDKSFLPDTGSEEAAEDETPPQRVCDEAYLLIRRLLKFNEDEVNYALNESEFLELPDQEKDEEIAKAMASKTWTTWVEESD